MDKSIRKTFPRFIIHDGVLSTLEIRQRENVLRQILKLEEKHVFQYITTMNSDEYQFETGLDLGDAIILRVEDSEQGSLMGFKF